MIDPSELLRRQAAWQRAQASLSWADKVRLAEAVRESLVRLKRVPRSRRATEAAGQTIPPAMTGQLDLVAGDPPAPNGFRYRPELLTTRHEAELLERFSELPFRAFEFHGYTGRRRVVSFGWKYDFASRTVEEAQPIPDFLLPLRELVAAFAELPAERLEQVLVTEYQPGSAIGWHRDKAEFGDVIGVSLAGACVFRFRRRRGAGWERHNLPLPPRSAYVLRGSARTEWEHSIPAVRELRYSVTFRTLRRRESPAAGEA